MLLVDWEIRKLCIEPGDGCQALLDPFSEGVSGGGVVSWGLSSAGYDLRLGPELVFFNSSSHYEVLDPKRCRESDYAQNMFINVRKESGPVIIPPNGHLLGRSLEYITMPSNLKGRCVGKSTLARVGVLINCTPVEPGWHGHLVIEIGNITPCPVRIYVGEGIAQLEFERLSSLPEKDYSQRGAKYQNQTGVTLARVL